MTVIDTRKFEGLRLSTYTDTTGHRTIGYGHNLDGGSDANIRAVGADPDKLRGKAYQITKNQAEAIFELDMGDVRKDVLTLVPDLDTHPAIVQDILCDLCFNLGLKGLAGFKRTLAAFRARNYRKAGENLRQSLWFRQTKTRAQTIVAVLEGMES